MRGVTVGEVCGSMWKYGGSMWEYVWKYEEVCVWSQVQFGSKSLVYTERFWILFQNSRSTIIDHQNLFERFDHFLCYSS